MVEFDFAQYFENLAVKNKQLHPDPDKPCDSFHRASSYVEMEGLIASSNSAYGFQLVIIDNEDGSLANIPDQTVDLPVYSFFLLHDFSQNNMDSRHQAITYCKRMMKSILSKMFRDAKAEAVGVAQNGLRHIDNVKYWTTGAVGNFIGLEISFTIGQPPAIKYDNNEWHV